MCGVCKAVFNLRLCDIVVVMNAESVVLPVEALADLLFADPGAALLLLDLSSRVQRANAAARQAFGSGCEVGQLAADLFELVDRPVVRRLVAQARDRARGDCVCVGGRFVVSVDALEAAGTTRGLLLRATDLVALRNLDPEQTQAGKLQALGLLAGGIAHDFNNLLTAVQGAAEAALDRLSVRAQADDATLEDLRTVRDGAGRGQALVRQLLAFGRQQTLQPRVVAVNQAVTDLTGLLRRLLGSQILVEVALEEPGRAARVDPGQLDQVLINLAVNARNAMPGGGTITLRTGHATLVSPQPASAAPGADMIAPGRYVTIAVLDSGCGIPAESLPRLFDPFFTTRRGQGGTGLGLASVHGIIRQSSGYVGVSSVPGGGTCFTVYLPRHVAVGPLAPTNAPVVAPLPAPARGSGAWVLLVEDEDPVRRLAARTLRQRGHEVVECESAEAALARLDSDGSWSRLGAVVSDVMLPGLDGPGLLRTVRRHRPGLPAILVSGYADATQRAALAAEGIAFLAKPYSQKVLAESVAGALQPCPA